jgi:hypothetical protein
VFYEIREYYLRVNSFRPFTEVWSREALPMLQSAGFDLVAAWLPDIGEDSSTTFTWILRWPDLNARTDAYAKLRSHEGWPAFSETTRDLIVRISNRIYRPLPFSPMQ